MPIQYRCATRAVDCQNKYDKTYSSSLSLQPGNKVLEISSLSKRRKITRRDCGWQHDLVPWSKPRKWKNKMIRHTQDSLWRQYAARFRANASVATTNRSD